MADDSQGFPKLDIKAARALRPNIHQIRIDSVLGGRSPMTNFAAPDQFRDSYGIDPSLIYSNSIYAGYASGLLVPTVTGTTTTSIFAGAPLWMLDNPKTDTIYIYDSTGSTYSMPGGTPSAISDAGAMSNASGNGAAYYDNYIYFAKNTTIARYGPLNGVATFDSDYWSTTLGKANLTNTIYPPQPGALFTIRTPNHVMHRHSDGKLYFADVTNNQGVIHVISTTKTTVEGDTDNGSKYQALTFGSGLYVTAIESYGAGLAISLVENKDGGSRGLRAKLAFWDTTSQNFNSITWPEFPDTYISALKNVNGILYIASGTFGQGFRVSRYVGGNSIEEVFYSETGASPLPGAIDGTSVRLLFGSYIYSYMTTFQPKGCVYSYNLQKKGVGNGLFVPYGCSDDLSSGAVVTALVIERSGLSTLTPITGWTNSVTNGVESMSTPIGGNATKTFKSEFHSQNYRTGAPAKITKISIPLADTLAAGNNIDVYLLADEHTQTLVGSINSSNFGTNTQRIVFRPLNLTIDNDFFLSLHWNGTGFITVALPIIVEYELLDVDTAYP